MRQAIHAFPAMLAALFLTGCAGLATLSAVTTPKDLYELTPKTTFPADLPTVDAQLVVDEPTAKSGLNTDRIAVKPDPFLIQYFPDSRWVDRAPLMIQTLLMESLESTGRIGAVGRQAIGLTSDYTLLTELREFQAQIEQGEGEEESVHALVRLNMKIVREPNGVIIASESFGTKVQAESLDMSDVVVAFDTALGQVMRDAVDWSVRRLDVAESGV